MQVLFLKDRRLIEETKKRKIKSCRMKWADERMRKRKRKMGGRCSAYLVQHAKVGGMQRNRAKQRLKGSAHTA